MKTRRFTGIIKLEVSTLILLLLTLSCAHYEPETQHKDLDEEELLTRSGYGDMLPVAMGLIDENLIYVFDKNSCTFFTNRKFKRTCTVPLFTHDTIDEELSGCHGYLRGISEMFKGVAIRNKSITHIVFSRIQIKDDVRSCPHCVFGMFCGSSCVPDKVLMIDLYPISCTKKKGKQ